MRERKEGKGQGWGISCLRRKKIYRIKYRGRNWGECEREGKKQIEKEFEHKKSKIQSVRMWKTGLSQCGKYLEHLGGGRDGENVQLVIFGYPTLCSTHNQQIYESHTAAPNYHRPYHKWKYKKKKKKKRKNETENQPHILGYEGLYL